MSEKKGEKQGSFVEPPMGEEIPAPSEPMPTPQDPEVPLFQKLDAIITEMKENTKALNGLAHQICRLADAKGAPTGTPTPPSKTPTFLEHKAGEEAPIQIPAKPEKRLPQPPPEVKRVMDAFPEDLRAKLSFSKRGNVIRVGIREYLGSENFARAGAVSRNLGGQYVSAGKESHFIVPIKPPEKTQTETRQAPTPAEPKPPTPQPTSGITVESIRDAFTKDLEDMLTFEDMGSWIRIAPRQYLGSENFAKIASVVRELKGEYVSAGKQSHFKVPKK